MGQLYDLAIVGGGPSGLSAAINGASEGLAVLLIDAAQTLGGQARESAAIENYPGFPDGITGDHLMSALTRQAEKFGCGLWLPTRIARLGLDDGTFSPPAYTLTDEFGQVIAAKTVLLSLGLSYRRLDAANLGGFLGNGAYYGLPSGRNPTHKCEVVVVGGANSSGQAVLHLARNSQATVRLLSRSPLAKAMSQYLIDRIHQTPNIEVLEDCIVKGCDGSRQGKLKEIEVEWHGEAQHIPADYLFMFIGAVPRTFWLSDSITLDKGFIPTWTDCGAELPFETSLRGVFAAGDVRTGSTKRIAAAVGEGAGALQMIHRRLA